MRRTSALAALLAVPLLGVTSRPLRAQTTLFLDGFEIGSVCFWSSSSPSFPCGEYQTCAKTAGDVWACFEEPFLAPPEPAEGDGVSGAHGIAAVDVYLLVDRTGSMQVEATALRNQLAAVINAVRCPPLGDGPAGSCYSDLWVGAGNVGYRGATGAPYSHRADLQSGAVAVANSILTMEPAGGCCDEATNVALWATATALGSAALPGCAVDAFPARATCVGSPAQNAGFETFGYPCFRQGALSLVVVTGDEPFFVQCPNVPNVVVPALLSVGLHAPGVASAAGQTTIDMQSLATSTGAVDRTNGNAPIVFLGQDAAAPQALQNALVASLPMTRFAAVSPEIVDDPGDPVDVNSAFVERLEALDGGDPSCATGLTRFDSDGDGFFDTFFEVPLGSVLCWRIVAKSNDTVPASETAQNYPATLRITTGVDPPADHPILFLVPPG